jgi:hypothetical protein
VANGSDLKCKWESGEKKVKVGREKIKKKIVKGKNADKIIFLKILSLHMRQMSPK